MVQTLQDIRVGGGSIKLGTTGTISALMSRELGHKESMLQVVPSLSSSTAISTGDEASRTLKCGDEASNSSSSVKNHKCPQNPKRKRVTPRIPMLKSVDTTANGTPAMKPHAMKVEIVDIKCGNPNRRWVNPITHRLKKLGFSKLSDSVA